MYPTLINGVIAMKIGDKALLDGKIVEIVEFKWNMARVKYLNAYSWIQKASLKPVSNK